MGRKNVKVPEDQWEEMNEHRKELDMSWPRYLDHLKDCFERMQEQGPLGDLEDSLAETIQEETLSTGEIRDILRQETKDAVRDALPQR